MYFSAGAAHVGVMSVRRDCDVLVVVWDREAPDEDVDTRVCD